MSAALNGNGEGGALLSSPSPRHGSAELPLNWPGPQPIHGLPPLAAWLLLFPFYRARRLAGDVETDAVDALNFVDDSVREFLQKLIRQSDPIGRHTVLRLHGADDDGVIVSALVAHHADAADG